MSWAFACNRQDIPEGGMKEVTIGGVPLLVLHAEGEMYAVPPLCPHMAEPLVNGMCDGSTLICIKHLWQWNLKDGAPEGEAETGLLKYELREDAGGAIHVRIESELHYDYQK